jgi:uncharacterized membrane-anchored protein YitT (DUF2179 family)
MLKKEITKYIFIVIGSLIYALATVLFVFPNKVLLGGTSGLAVILSGFIPLSSGTFSVILNLTLIAVAFIVLGRTMATHTLVGSLLTTVFIGALEPLLSFDTPLVDNEFAAALLAGGTIAVASGMLFYVDSSSGGTDILALIIKKYRDMNIGRALLVSDVLIVLIGGMLAGGIVLLYSFLAFLVKTLGIDFFITAVRKIIIKVHK